MARNTTPYHPELTTHEAISYLVRSEPWAKLIWRTFCEGTSTRPDYATALELILLTLAYQRDEARMELEAIAREQLAEARRERAAAVLGEATMTVVSAGEPTAVATK